VDEGGNYKHGGTGTTEHDIWRAMIERCRNPKFKDYAGRGISVCQRWLDSFEDFLADMGHRPSSGHSIERERNEENYEPGNCVWATAKQQGRNKRNNILVEYAGRTMVLSEAAEVAGINYKRAWWRINAGWGVQRALTP
jgi:hypothetical protein